MIDQLLIIPVKMSIAVKLAFACPCFPVFDVETFTPWWVKDEEQYTLAAVVMVVHIRSWGSTPHKHSELITTIPEETALAAAMNTIKTSSPSINNLAGTALDNNVTTFADLSATMKARRWRLEHMGR